MSLQEGTHSLLVLYVLSHRAVVGWAQYSCGQLVMEGTMETAVTAMDML